MVSVRFAATGFTSGNQARPLFALGMDDHEYPARCISAQSDKAPFSSGIGILDGESHRIAKRLLRVSEADTVFAQVCLGLCRVELDGQAPLCISNAYMQVTNCADAPFRWLTG